MKRILSVMLFLALLCGACLACAEGTGYQAPAVLDASDLAGVPTHYLLYAGIECVFGSCLARSVCKVIDVCENAAAEDCYYSQHTHHVRHI